MLVGSAINPNGQPMGYVVNDHGFAKAAGTLEAALSTPLLAIGAEFSTSRHLYAMRK